KPEPLDHVRNGAQIVVSCRRGIAAYAVQDGQFLAAAAASSVDRLLDFLGIGHAGGDDHRLAGARDVLDQGQIDRLERRDLVGRSVQLLEQVDSSIVERRTEYRDAQLARMLEQRLVPLPGGVRLDRKSVV